MDRANPDRFVSSQRIGDSLERVEDDRLLRGEGGFIDDLELGSRTAHVAFLRSPHANAIVRAIEKGPALAIPGVIAVWTARDVAGIVKPMVSDTEQPGLKVTKREVLATDRARFVGDTLAMAMASDPYLAVDATEAIETTFEVLPAVARALEAAKPDAPRVHESIDDNVLYETSSATPDFTGIHAAAPLRIKERFVMHRVAGVPIEPRGCAASFDPKKGVLTVWSSTQCPSILHNAIAEHLELRQSDIRVVTPDIGGGFGPKAAVYPEELLVAAASMRLRRPVKWIQDRYDDFLTSTQARDHAYEVEIGFTQEGRLVSLLADILVNVGAYSTMPFGASFEANGASRNMPGAYRLSNFAFHARAVCTNTCPTGAYRGVSAPVACMVMEGMLDRIGRLLNLDPAEVRRRNLVTDFPYKNVLGLPYREGCFLPTMDRCLELADYPELRRRQADARDGKLRGVSVVVITEQTGMGAARFKQRGLFRIPGYEGALVKIEPDGTATACVSMAAIGQGSATSFTQIISDKLGVPAEDVRIVTGDTGRGPTGTGTIASRGMVVAGNAVLAASGKVAEKMSRIAGAILDRPPEDIFFADGYAQVKNAPNLHVSVARIASVAYSSGETILAAGESHGLESVVYYDTPSAEVASAAHVVAVAVDPRTGCVEIEKYAVVHDCGRMITPNLVDGQIHGGVAQGLGEVLMEEIVYSDDGQPLSVSLMEYQMPRCVDFSAMEIDAVHSEMGSKIIKGVGEGGTIGAVPAIVNAIGDALAKANVNVNEIPLSAQAIRSMMRHAAASSASPSNP
jgi:aerobic carbon-monoxide dehydrogenase large subunit